MQVKYQIFYFEGKSVKTGFIQFNVVDTMKDGLFATNETYTRYYDNQEWLCEAICANYVDDRIKTQLVSCNNDTHRKLIDNLMLYSMSAKPLV